MAHPQFSIGIDLGTTNCAMAFERLDAIAAQRDVFFISQWETSTRFSEASTLPSFLYLLSQDEAAQMSGHSTLRAEWVPRALRENTGGGIPGSRRSLRKVMALPSCAWIATRRSCHGDPMKSRSKSGFRRSARPRCSWNIYAQRGTPSLRAQGQRFEDQEITITVPASFDAAAQRLTLDAAREAGFPEGVRLLEEPQAAFYRWLDRGAGESAASKQLSDTGVHHVLVIDIGGGTTDFTLFEIASPTGDRPFATSSESP